MKNICALLLLISQLAVAQSGIVGHNANGLLYTDTGFSNLKHIADSLHEQFKSIPTANYNSVPQSYCVQYISIRGKESVKVKHDIDAGLSYKDIRAKYPKLSVLDSAYVTRSNYTYYKKGKALSINREDQGAPVSLKMYFDGNRFDLYKDLNSGWLYNYYDINREHDEYLEACYIAKPLILIPLKSKYARLVQYSGLFTDADKIFYVDAKAYDVEFPNAPIDMLTFLNYANTKLNMPQQGDYEGRVEYSKKWSKWQSGKWILADKLYSTDSKFKELLTQAYNSTPKGATNTDFEDYLWRYHSKEIALDYKRSRRIFSFRGINPLSQQHMWNIAVLAARTRQWDVFMRARLSIIDADFNESTEDSRRADRHAYVEGLERLGINVGDLLIGMCLKVNEADEDHYYSSMNDIGKTISEAKDRETIADKLLEMVQDPDLDFHNRIRMCYVFLNYNSCLKDGAERIKNKTLLKKAVASFPKGILYDENFVDHDDSFYSEF